MILVGNKTDLVRARQITEEEAKSVAVSLNCKYVEVYNKWINTYV